MSLRTRLLVFFIGIVLVPGLVVAGVLLVLVDRTETGEAGARLEVAQRAAVGLFEDYQGRAARVAEIIGGDATLAAALRDADAAAVRTRLRQLSATARAV